MAVNYRKYNTVNTKELTKDQDRPLGITLPFDGSGVFNLSYTTKSQLKTNLINTLLTEPGERIFMPEFGVGLRSLLFESEPDKDAIQQNIMEQVKRYVPFINQIIVDVVKPSNSHTITIKITYQALNEIDAFNLNFTSDGRSEGPTMGPITTTAVGATGY